MTEKELKPDLEEANVEVDEEVESVDTLKDMIKTLNELPTDVLEQLLKNLDEVEEYNKTHPLSEDDEEDTEE